MEHSEVHFGDEPQLTAEQRRPRMRRSGFGAFFSILCGIVLPTAALVVELTLRLCSSVFFDPIPSMFHTLLVATVPLANLLLLLSARGRSRLNRTAVAVASGFSLGVSAVYALLFLPIVPISIFYSAMSFAALFLPACITTLPFSPFAGLLAGFFAFRRLAREAAPEAQKRLRRAAVAGCGIALTSMALVELPRTLTRTQLEVLSSSPNNSNALSLLRKFGNEQMILEAAYGAETPHYDFLGWLESTLRAPSLWSSFGGSRHTIESELARKVFYQVTGESFNSRARPRPSVGLFSLFGASDVGKTAVGGRSESVSLSTSTLDASLDPNTLTAYTEWTMVFRNTGASQDEARAVVRLPSGGVVSRATLWVNGEEREAVFGGRAEVVAAYQRVTMQRRDPLLVTSAGPNAVLVQCFPVPPQGEMKIRIGITSPLVVESGNHATITLPHFTERNFDVEKQAGRSLWLESKTSLKANAGDLSAAQPQTSLFTLRGTAEFETNALIVTTALDGLPQDVFSKGDGADSAVVYRQRVEMAQLERHRSIVFVFDGSKAMNHYAADLVAAVQHLQDGADIALILADDSAVALTNGLEHYSPELGRRLADGVRAFDFTGGRDNGPAILAALNAAMGSPDSVVVWFHGPQPITPAMEPILQLKRRRPKLPHVIGIELAEGSNELAAELERMGILETPPPSLTGNTTVAQQVNALVSGASYYRIRRELVATPIASGVAPASYGHLNRLAANDQVSALLRSDLPTAKVSAKELAIKARIVTPVSGAVVLENDEQYRQSGLEPPNADTVPVIPEPETVALLVVAIILLLIARRVRPCPQHL
ncbi:MAG: VIT domain-containing protein [Bdellovibrionota bacterium]